LLRVVAAGTLVVPDESARMPGRGAYVHRDPQCLDLAERRRALGRALRVTEALDLRAVRDTIGVAVSPAVESGDASHSAGAALGMSTVSSPSEGRSSSDEPSMSMQR